MWHIVAAEGETQNILRVPLDELIIGGFAPKALQRAGRRNQFQDRQRRNHAEVVRPKHADQPFGQLRQFVIELVAQAPHQEGKALE